MLKSLLIFRLEDGLGLSPSCLERPVRRPVHGGVRGLAGEAHDRALWAEQGPAHLVGHDAQGVTLRSPGKENSRIAKNKYGHECLRVYSSPKRSSLITGPYLISQ